MMHKEGERCISLLHYCKSLVGVLQDMFSNNHVFFLMLYCGVDVLNMSAQELQLHKCSERRLSFRSPKVGTIVTNNAERPTSVQH